MTTRCGFIGLGEMGKALCAELLHCLASVV
jgi:3-hydroxyisobutyrate dehydrogenase-like beta-hydroxyacid dehydrogenase